MYEPKGKAGEYADLACNIYRGCAHGCTYCYAPTALRMDRAEFADPQPRYGVVQQLKREAWKHRGREIFFCFTCDPYQPIERSFRLMPMVIDACHRWGITVTILSKGGVNAMDDFSLLARHPELVDFGQTLTFITPDDSEKWEPKASSPAERMYALEQAKRAGFRTWASLEPVIDPEQTLDLIRQTHVYVDRYAVGKWNHDERAEAIDWKSFGKRAIELLEGYGKAFYIKHDLRILL